MILTQFHSYKHKYITNNFWIVDLMEQPLCMKERFESKCDLTALT